MNSPERKILLNPGPATTSDSVKMAQVVSDICPREQEFADMVDTIMEDLTNIVADTVNYRAVLFGGSGTAAVETTLASVPPESRLFIVNNGAYGKRMCSIADTYRLDYTEYKSPEYEPLNLSEIDSLLSGGEYTHIYLVHHETTTGLLNDIEAIGVLARKNQLRYVVDAMSSFAAIPIDMTTCGIDFLVASSNKNIQGMAGLGFVIASLEALDELKNVPARCFYLSLYDQYSYYRDKRQFRFTPPVQTIYALKTAITEFHEEGLTGRSERYSRLWKLMTEGMEKLGFKMLVDPKFQSKIITSFLEPETEGYSFDNLHDYLFDRGITIYPGKAMGINTFRIANIGDLHDEDIEKFLEGVKGYFQTFPN